VLQRQGIGAGCNVRQEAQEDQAVEHGPVGRTSSVLYRIGAPFAVVATVFLFGAGLATVMYALWKGVVHTYVDGVNHGFHEGIAAVLNGIELLLVAPLVYLVLATMTTLVVSVKYRLAALNGPFHQAREDKSRVHLEGTFALVHRVKQAVAGLFVAVLLTDFLARILNQEPFTWVQIAAQSSALLIAVAYYALQGDAAGREVDARSNAPIAH
jgi:hypothetical protein